MKVLISLSFLILIPLNAWAFVPHEYPAIYTHQLGGIFYFIALSVFLWVITYNRLHKQKGWRYLFLSLIFFIIWDIDVLVSRFVEAWWIDPERFRDQTIGGTEGWQYFTRHIRIEGAEYLYYIGRLDFILLNAATLLFYMGLREHLQKEDEKSSLSMSALLPLLPIFLTEIGGSITFIVLSMLSLVTSFKLYKKDRENPLWHYMVWLSSSYLMFSFSRFFGHILKHILIATGNQYIWTHLYLDGITGSFNTSIRFLVATLTLFFIWIHRIYLKMSKDKEEIELINLDLTELNQKLEAGMAERTKLIEQLEKDKIELRELDGLKSAFLAQVSHELRTPMNAIIGYTELLLDRVDGAINEEQEKSLKKVLANSRHLLQLINNILDISGIESGKIKLEVKELVLKGLVESVIPTFEPEMKQKGLTLTINIDENLSIVYGDESKIKQILINLLSNAVKFTHKGGITIIAKASVRDIGPGEPSQFAEICVEDTGIGIREEDLCRIFEKFAQVDISYVRQYEGAGLGLSITRELIALHKGAIWVTSKYGEGSRFCFTLPLKKEMLEKTDEK